MVTSYWSASTEERGTLQANYKLGLLGRLLYGHSIHSALRLLVSQMSYLAVLTFLLLLFGFSFAHKDKDNQLSWPKWDCTRRTDDNRYGWVRPSNCLSRHFFDSYCIVQTVNAVTYKGPCEMAANVLSACNQSSMSFPLYLSPSHRNLS